MRLARKQRMEEREKRRLENDAKEKAEIERKKAAKIEDNKENKSSIAAAVDDSKTSSSHNKRSARSRSHSSHEVNGKTEREKEVSLLNQDFFSFKFIFKQKKGATKNGTDKRYRDEQRQYKPRNDDRGYRSSQQQQSSRR